MSLVISGHDSSQSINWTSIEIMIKINLQKPLKLNYQDTLLKRVLKRVIFLYECKCWRNLGCPSFWFGFFKDTTHKNIWVIHKKQKIYLLAKIGGALKNHGLGHPNTDLKGIIFDCYFLKRACVSWFFESSKLSKIHVKVWSEI